MKDFFRRLFSKKASAAYVDFRCDSLQRYIDKRVLDSRLDQVNFTGSMCGILNDKIMALYKHLGLDWDGQVGALVKRSPAKPPIVKKVKGGKK